jgi:hypothetical protein
MYKYGGLGEFDVLGNIRVNVRRHSNDSLKNCTVQTNFISIVESQSSEVHVQSGRRRTGTVPLCNLVDYALDIGASRNRNLNADNYRISGFQMYNITATREVSVDGDDKRERNARTRWDGDSLRFIR